MTDVALWALALFGVFNLGIVANLLFWYGTNNLPWQHTVKLHEQKATKALALAEDRETELKQIREVLLSAIPKNR